MKNSTRSYRDLPGEWESTCINNILTLEYGKALKENDRIDGECPVYGSNGIIGFHDQKLVSGPGIIVGRKGSAGEVLFSATDFFPIDTTFYVKTNLDNKFVYYLLKSLNIKQLVGSSAVPGLNRNDLYSQQVNIPKNAIEQHQIAEILSSLDDKIELNRCINANLEAVASALFKRWFIDFGFPDKNGQPYKTNNGKMLTSELGPIPDGWSINQAQELFDFTKGIEPGNKNYTSIESEITIPFFRVADLFNGNQSKTYINKSIAGTVITSNNDVLIATDGTVGRVATGLYGSYSGGIKKVISKDKSIGNSFIYFWLKSSIVQNKLKEYASSATTIAHASGAIKDLKIAYNKEIIKKFCVLSQPIFEEIINNLSENIKIKKVIDLLLPRLMSGKIKA